MAYKQWVKFVSTAVEQDNTLASLQLKTTSEFEAGIPEFPSDNKCIIDEISVPPKPQH